MREQFELICLRQLMNRMHETACMKLSMFIHQQYRCVQLKATISKRIDISLFQLSLPPSFLSTYISLRRHSINLYPFTCSQLLHCSITIYMHTVQYVYTLEEDIKVLRWGPLCRKLRSSYDESVHRRGSK